MSAQPLLVLGERRRRLLLSRLAEQARRWRAGWAPDAAEKFDAQCEPSSMAAQAPVAALATHCWALDERDERLAILLLPHTTFAWCVQENGGLSPESAGTLPADSLAERLEHEVATTLLREVAAPDSREAGVVSRVDGDCIEAWSRTTRAWRAELRASESGRAFSLLLSARRMEALAPARAMPRGALESRRHAVGENRVRLRALAGDTAMSVSELAQLAVDDVLVLDQRLSDPVTLVAEQSGLGIAVGSLGRAGARRALKLGGISGQKN